MQLNKKTALIFVAALAASSQAFAARYLVVFNNKEVFNQTHIQLVMQQKNLASVRIQGAQPFANVGQAIKVQDSLQNLNMLVVDAKDEKALEALKASGAVAMVEKEVFHPAPRPVNGFHLTRAWDYNLAYSARGYSSIGQTGPKTPWGINAVKAPDAWAASNYGSGSRVLVLDTGIDKDHPAVKDNYEKGQNFVGDTNPGGYPEADGEGHGTHVSGTIAASFGADGFVGVAPQAHLLMGRVCAADGCSNIAVANGINWGITEKVDVISMSLGGPFGTAAEKRAVEAADRAGIVVVAASGNDGQGTVSFPAAFPTVIAVGAVDVNSQKAAFSNWGPQLAIVAPGVAVVSSVPRGTGREAKVSVGAPGQEANVPASGFVGAPDVPSPVSNTLVFAGLGKPEDFQGVDVKGKFALIQRGEIAFAAKATNAIAAGAAGVVIFNNAPGLIQGALTQDGTIMTIPVVMIEQTIGESLRDQLAAGQTASAVIQTIATDYASFDGTSMATPHIAGVVALVKAAKRSATPAQVRTALTSTATALGPNDQNQYGAGLVNAAAAVQAIQ